MCGILYTTDPAVSEAAFNRALDLMEHRGPDARGYALSGASRLGHRRLSILDLHPRSNQPFRRGDRLLIFNGEIYNYRELIREHALKVETSSDTEVILAMYEKYGEGCLGYFNGMFAFVIHDETTGEAFVARDRLGVKPLYLHRGAEGWTLASEIAPLLELFGGETDDFGLRQYRKLRMTLKGRTLYRDISVFPQAHYWKGGDFVRWWDLDVSTRPPPSYDELSALIADAVRLRKISDVPVGSYLSGGLDSTILTYLLEPDHTWTVGFPEMNEFDWSERAAKGLRSTHHRTVVDRDGFLRTAEWMIRKRKEPLSVPNEVLLYLMTRDVKSENTVVLSGEGADELFWGYDRIFRWAHGAKTLDPAEFDRHYCYGSHRDDEVVDYALEGLPGKLPVEKLAYFFQIHHLHGLLRRVDNSTMLCSVEARVPFVDYRLVERVAGAPFAWRMGSSFKQPLKDIYGGLIPKEIVDRPKVGFPVPLESLFGASSPGTTPMDAWLRFNLDNLLTPAKET